MNRSELLSKLGNYWSSSGKMASQVSYKEMIEDLGVIGIKVDDPIVEADIVTVEPEEEEEVVKHTRKRKSKK